MIEMRFVIRPILFKPDGGSEGADVDDFDAFEKEFNDNWKEPEVDPADPATDPIDPAKAVDPEVPIVDPAKADPDPANPNPADPKPADPEVKAPVQTPEANRAFQELRQKAAENQRQADFVKGLADEAGLSVDDFLKAIADSKLEKEAVALGKDPELYKKSAQQQAEIDALKSDNSATKFQARIEKAQADLKLTDLEVSETLVKGVQMGVDVTQIPFETLHKLVNPVDVEALKKQAVQDHLEAELKKQTSYVPHGTGGSSTGGASSVDDDVNAYLREKGDIK